VNATNYTAHSQKHPIRSCDPSQTALSARVERVNDPLADAKNIYEQLRPMIVWLGLTELGWIGYWLLSGDGNTPTFMVIAVAWMVSMLIWLALAIYAGRSGFFLKHSERLSNLVSVTIIVAFAVVVFAAIPAGWQGLVNAARHTSDLQLIYIHVLRLLAIGSIVKYVQRELPLHFVILGSLPDILFAASAVYLAVLGAKGPLDPSFLVGWHLIGFSVFFGAGISMFFSVPSPLRIFHTKPDTSIVFQFPMVLAPNMTVPLFMIAHLFALVKILAG
jgi:hypothetical protein